MKAKDFVLQRFPNATHFTMIDNGRGRNSYVILKNGTFADGLKVGYDIFPNEGETTSSKAWTNAKKYILDKNEPCNSHSIVTAPWLR